MAKHSKHLKQRKRIKFFVFILIIILLAIISASFFVCRYFVANKDLKNKSNNYLIENKYYGFELKTPKNWLAEENAFYSADNIEELINKCKSGNIEKSSFYQIGTFRFKDQKYPQNFGISGYFPDNVPTGAILEIAVNCVPSYMKDKVSNYGYGSLKIGGAKATQENLNLFGFGETKYLSFFHNDVWYKISEYIYISANDERKNEASIRDGYDKIFNEILSSFRFVK